MFGGFRVVRKLNCVCMSSDLLLFVKCFIGGISGTKNPEPNTCFVLFFLLIMGFVLLSLVQVVCIYSMYTQTDILQCMQRGVRVSERCAHKFTRDVV